MKNDNEELLNLAEFKEKISEVSKMITPFSSKIPFSSKVFIIKNDFNPAETFLISNILLSLFGLYVIVDLNTSLLKDSFPIPFLLILEKMFLIFSFI